ncbi:MAG: hypothetical protein ACREMG_08995, partial [Gemmatimonadales bacterium]
PEGGVVGGHAVCAYGYRVDPAAAGGGYIKARNSWGGWTADGDLRFHFEHMANPRWVWDCWTLHLRQEDAPGP